ncbi:type II secretion system F family protein [Amycolatopsis echigonensis]|uniref:Tight adherence protein B n=1 Tax=Amycolatopsis echigonensis TaxID=2576905 RepID=A0A2N3WI13_9PSEU|nr:type II secretion system F family protein [Amycolatopsis echigonensis]MBB2503153.1 type II secretion system F family protein [Amycolatopsis echigonensis]PKV93498.1 tight adherence protein B [Amycolatopsis niigatensis]
MISAWPFLCAGTGILCWPTVPNRLLPTPRLQLRVLIPPRRVLWLAPAVVALPLGGIGAAIATALLTLAVRQEWRSRRETSETLTRGERTSTVLRTMVSELRAGAHPVTAAEAAADAVPELAAELHNLSAAARLDGTLESAVLPAVAQSWNLARRHGLPIADALEAARRDVDAEVAFTRRLRAKMAGPRMSAIVLTVLPVGCLAMGQLIGANPLAVLTETLIGQAFLVAGAALLWAGTAWSRALTNRKVAP